MFCGLRKREGLTQRDRWRHMGQREREGGKEKRQRCKERGSSSQMELLKGEEREQWGSGRMALSSPCLLSPDFAAGSAEGHPGKSQGLSQF